MIELLIFTVLGYVLGKVDNGFTIRHEQALPEQEKEGYNESMQDELPPEMKEYFDKNNGNYKF